MVNDYQAWREAEDKRDAEEQRGGAATLKIYGNADNKISPYLKAWISQPDADSSIRSCVVGLIGQGTSRSLQSNWTSPFEQSNIGGLIGRVADYAQVFTGRTSITTLSSTQVWDGNRPSTFQLVLSFYALSDAYREVMAPLRELEMMMGPDIMAGNAENGKIVTFIKNAIPGGSIPQPVILNIGRRMMIPGCVIESISAPIDAEKTDQGHLVRADVTLSISTKVMLNRENIEATWR